MKRLFVVFLGLLWAGPAFAVCTNTVTVKDGAGVSQTFCRGTDGTNMISAVNILDSAGGNFASVTAANALKTQDAGDMTGTTPGTAPSNTLIVGGISNSALPSPTAGQTLPLQLDNSGRVIVSLGASSPTVNVAVASALPTGANTIGKVDILGNAGATLDAVVGAATAPTNMLAVGGVFNSSPLTLTNGQSSALQLDTSGNLRISGLAQASTTSGQTGSLVMGAATTTAPAYTTAQTDPISLDTFGNTRVLNDGGCAGQSINNTNVAVINLTSTTVTKLVSKVAAKKVYICQVHLVTATAQNVALIEGSLTTNQCDTTPAGLAGGTTAASGYDLAANGGLTLGNGQGVVLKSGTANLDVCIVSSGTSQVSGTITWAQF